MFVCFCVSMRVSISFLAFHELPSRPLPSRLPAKTTHTLIQAHTPHSVCPLHICPSPNCAKHPDGSIRAQVTLGQLQMIGSLERCERVAPTSRRFLRVHLKQSLLVSIVVSRCRCCCHRRRCHGGRPPGGPAQQPAGRFAWPMSAGEETTPSTTPEQHNANSAAARPGPARRTVCSRQECYR
jgi:hypothetical protein